MYSMKREKTQDGIKMLARGASIKMKAQAFVYSFADPNEHLQMPFMWQAPCWEPDRESDKPRGLASATLELAG